MANPAKLIDWSPFRFLRDLAATIRAIALFALPATAAAFWVAKRFGASPEVVVAVSLGAASTVIAAAAAFSAGRAGAERATHKVLTDSSTQLVERVNNHHRYTWRREIVIKSRRDGLRILPYIWYWTGQTSKPVSYGAVALGQAIFTTGVPEPDQAVYRWIYLGRPLAKGEEVKTGINWAFEDDVVPMQRFMAIAPRAKTGKLILTLRFPAAEEPSSVEVIHSPTWNLYAQPRLLEGRTPKRCVTVPGMVDFVVEEVNPKPFKSLGMRWSQ